MSSSARGSTASASTGSDAPSLAVVIPMYGEQDQAERCVRLVCAALDALPARSAMIVVDDGSHDRTGEILARLARETARLSVLTHSANRGYGAALRTGVARAAEMGLEYVLFMDSDLTNDPAYLPNFMARMREGCDVIKASRYVAGGRVEGVASWRRALSIVGNGVARALYRLPMRDCTNGFRALRTSLYQQMRLEENGFPMIMEELYQAKFLARTFCEFPYTLTARSASLRPSSFTYRPGVLLQYLKYPVKAFLRQVPSHLAARRSRGGGAP